MKPRHKRRPRAVPAAVVAWMLLSWSPSAFALNPALDVSQYGHTSWKIREGFTKGSIGAIAQTSDGYLWLGTEFGLLRFDGARIVPWEPPPNQSLPSNGIRSLLATRDGTLWIGTLRGLASWKSGRLTNYAALAGTLVAMLLEDRDGTIWASSQATDNAKLCSIRNAATDCDASGSLGRYVSELSEDREGSLWVGTANGFWRWKPDPPQFYPLPGEPNGIRGIADVDDGTLVIPTRGSIRRWTHGAQAPPIPMPARARAFQANRILRDRDGGLWMGTTGGGIVHLHQGRLDVFGQSDGLSSDNANGFFEDREGNVWVTTNDGLDRFREPVAATFGTEQGLSTSLVTSVLGASDGSVWLGSFEGLNRWVDGRNTIYRARRTPAASDPPNAENVREINGPGLPAHGVHALAEGHGGRIWVSTRDGVGFIEHDRWTSIPGIPGGNFNAIVEDSQGTAWIAHLTAGLFQVLPKGIVRHVPLAELGHDDVVSTLVADRVRGGVWLGFTHGGIARMSDVGVREAYTVSEGLANGRVNAFQFDPDGTLWAATDNGLSVLRNGRVRTLTGRDGLPCDRVHWAREDDTHAFWLFTPCGLARIARSDLDAGQTVHPTVYDNSEGIRVMSSIGTYTPHVSKSSDGRLWFSTTNGVSVIDPRRIPFNPLPPPVHIELMTADRTAYDAGSAPGGRLPLPPLMRDLQIDYTALSLVAPEKNRFRIKLEGWDRDWQDVGSRRQAYYNNLPPRSYRFRVIASNNSGVWNEAGATLDFSIAPGYYQTLWFRMGVILAALALLWAAYQYRLRQIAQEFDARLRERVNERTRIARDLHDTLLQSFHGLLFRFQAATNMLPDRPVEAKQKFESAIDQAAQAITEGRDAVQNLRASTVITNDLGVAISTLAQELAAAHNQNAATPTIVDVAVEGTPRDLHPILRDDIYRVAGEALRNAFRHARARRIEVEIRYDDNELHVRVRDDGQGVDPVLLDEERPGHFGIRGMRERAELVGGRLDVWSKAGLGTEVELTIPGAVAYATLRRRILSWRFAGRTGTNS